MPGGESGEVVTVGNAFLEAMVRYPAKTSKRQAAAPRCGKLTGRSRSYLTSSPCATWRFWLQVHNIRYLLGGTYLSSFEDTLHLTSTFIYEISSCPRHNNSPFQAHDEDTGGHATGKGIHQNRIHITLDGVDELNLFSDTSSSIRIDWRRYST